MSAALRDLLRPGTTVVLVDWPNEDVPLALLRAGCIVSSVNHARGTASSYGIGDDGASLVIRPLDVMPARSDVVCAYRPPEELTAITRHAVTLGARTVWSLGGALPEDARAIADAVGMIVVENASVADALRD